MATANGIVIINEKPESYSITARVIPEGQGHLYIKGRVAEDFPASFDSLIKSVTVLSEYMDGISLDAADIQLRIITPYNYPLTGNSYGLTAAMAILASATGKTIPSANCYTGRVDEAGNIGLVDYVHQKRRGAAGLGFTKFFLPLQQIDLLSTYITQCPCSSLADAYGITFWGDK